MIIDWTLLSPITITNSEEMQVQKKLCEKSQIIPRVQMTCELSVNILQY